MYWHSRQFLAKLLTEDDPISGLFIRALPAEPARARMASRGRELKKQGENPTLLPLTLQQALRVIEYKNLLLLAPAFLGGARFGHDHRLGPLAVGGAGGWGHGIAVLRELRG